MLDNLESYVLWGVTEFAKENGFVLLTLRPHTSHKLQSADKAVFSHLKPILIKLWWRSHSNKRFCIYYISECIKETYLKAMTPKNIISCSASTGIYLYNVNAFDEREFAASLLSDRLNAVKNNTSTNFHFANTNTAATIKGTLCESSQTVEV